MHDGCAQLASVHHADWEQPDPILPAEAEASIHGVPGLYTARLGEGGKYLKAYALRSPASSFRLKKCTPPSTFFRSQSVQFPSIQVL